MTISKVPGMTKIPGCCMVCNSTPTGSDGVALPSVDLDIDYDWGNNGYLCAECVDVIADLMDRVSVEEHKALQAEHREAMEENGKLKKAYRKKKKDVKKLTDALEVKV